MDAATIAEVILVGGCLLFYFIYLLIWIFEFFSKFSRYVVKPGSNVFFRMRTFLDQATATPYQTIMFINTPPIQQDPSLAPTQRCACPSKKIICI